MSWFRSDPSLPPGDTGRFLIGNTFTFHESPQGLVLDTVQRYPTTPVIRLKVINRNVALVLKHDLAQQVVGNESQTRFGHRDAYAQLLAAFYPDPNILLEDEWEAGHTEHRKGWEEHFASLPRTLALDGLSPILDRHKKLWQTPVKLYKACKSLAHEIVFHLFLGLDAREETALYDRAVAQTDSALHGQFSAPLRVGLGGYESTYSRGLQAQAEFNAFTATRMSSGLCPFLGQPPRVGSESTVSHMSIFASSLVVKALASYLTFAFLQRSRSPHANIDHLLLETERLASPIIGLLRRVLDRPWSPTSDLTVPVGWDAWVYFPIINRSEEIYGHDARSFRPERWEEDLPEPMTFGGGARKCLGVDLVRQIVASVLQGMSAEMDISVGDIEPSVKDFLGWELGSQEQRWAGIKQLPVQRPRRDVTLRLCAASLRT